MLNGVRRSDVLKQISLQRSPEWYTDIRSKVALFALDPVAVIRISYRAQEKTRNGILKNSSALIYCLKWLEMLTVFYLKCE